LPTQKKIDAMDEFRSRLQSHMLIIAAQYQGITVEQVTELRRKLREQNIEFKVYKNTLVRRVLDELGLSAADAFISGPTAWAFSNDAVAPSKIFKEISKEVKALVMNGGIFEGRAISKQQVASLATMPPREVLLAQVAGTMVAPLRNFLGVLNALPRSLVNVLDQIRKQKEEAAAA
jgi:large subunit ribosomal protein L10